MMNTILVLMMILVHQYQISGIPLNGLFEGNKASPDNDLDQKSLGTVVAFENAKTVDRITNLTTYLEKESSTFIETIETDVEEITEDSRNDSSSTNIRGDTTTIFDPLTNETSQNLETRTPILSKLSTIKADPTISTTVISSISGQDTITSQDKLSTKSNVAAFKTSINAANIDNVQQKEFATLPSNLPTTPATIPTGLIATKTDSTVHSPTTRELLQSSSKETIPVLPISPVTNSSVTGSVESGSVTVRFTRTIYVQVNATTHTPIATRSTEETISTVASLFKSNSSVTSNVLTDSMVADRTNTTKSSFLATLSKIAPVLVSNSTVTPLIPTSSMATTPLESSHVVTSSMTTDSIIKSLNAASHAITNSTVYPLTVTNSSVFTLKVKSSTESSLAGTDSVVADRTITSSDVATAIDTNWSVSTPIVTDSSVSTSIVTSSSGSTPIVTNSSVSTPIVTSSGISIPIVTSSNVSTPIITSLNVSNPIVTSLSVSTPMVANSSVSTPIVTSSSVSTPIVANSSVSTPIVTSITFSSFSTSKSILSTLLKSDSEVQSASNIPNRALSSVTKMSMTHKLRNRIVTVKFPLTFTTNSKWSTGHHENGIKRSDINRPSRVKSLSDNFFDPVCTLEVDEGVGAGTHSTWYYNASSRKCEWFNYRGSKGNGNRFNYRANCEHHCISPQNNLCSRSDIVKCFETWLECRMEYDKYCHEEADSSNRNKWLFCPPPQPICIPKIGKFRKAPQYLTNRAMTPVECFEHRDPGLCFRNSNSELVFYYNPIFNDCYGFLYSRCGGNSNRFASKPECMTHCAF